MRHGAEAGKFGLDLVRTRLHRGEVVFPGGIALRFAGRVGAFAGGGDGDTRHDRTARIHNLTADSTERLRKRRRREDDTHHDEREDAVHSYSSFREEEWRAASEYEGTATHVKLS